jgi:hypothetical protein
VNERQTVWILSVGGTFTNILFKNSILNNYNFRLKYWDFFLSKCLTEVFKLYCISCGQMSIFSKQSWTLESLSCCVIWVTNLLDQLPKGYGGQSREIWQQNSTLTQARHFYRQDSKSLGNCSSTLTNSNSLLNYPGRRVTGHQHTLPTLLGSSFKSWLQCSQLWF